MLSLLIDFLLAFLIVRMILNIVVLKKERGKVLELQNKYLNASKEELLAMNNDALIEGVSFKVSDRYNKLNGALANLKDSEKVLLAYDQLKICCTTARMSVNNFFADYTPLILFTNQVFDIIQDGKESFAGAHELYLKYEAEAQKDINEVLDAYDDDQEEEKTFVDYTNELKVVFNNPETVEKMAEYVKEHIEDFTYTIETEEEVDGFIDED